MWRKMITILVGLALAWGMAGALVGYPDVKKAFAAPLNQKSYHAQRFDVLIKILPGGDLLISETVVFQFVGGTFSFAFREIPVEMMDSLEILSVQLDGEDMPFGDQPGQAEITSGNPVKVQWNFGPLSDQVHRFTLNYRVYAHVHQEGDYDTLDWDVLPNSHEYDIENSLVTIEYPEGVTLSQPPWVVRGSADVEQVANQVMLSAVNLGPDDPLQIRLRFPAGSLVPGQPAWLVAESTRAAVQAQMMQAGFSAGIGALLVGLLGLLFAFQRLKHQDRDGDTTPPVGVSLVSPPSNLPPALAGMLVSGGRSLQWQHGLGVLFDLARKDAVAFEQREFKLIGKFGVKQFFIVRKNFGAGLRPEEQAYLDALFQGKEMQQGEIALTQLPAQVQKGWADLNRMAVEALESAGLSSAQRKDTSRQLGRLGLWVTLGSVAWILAVFFVLRGLFGPIWFAGFLGLGIGVLLAGMAIALTGSAFSPLNARGLQQAALWKGFADYLGKVTKGKEPPVRPDYYDVYLPYAAAFGLAEPWTKYFEKRGEVVLPSWFVPLAGMDSSDSMSALVSCVGATSSAGGDGGSGGGGGDGGGGGGGSSGAG